MMGKECSLVGRMREFFADFETSLSVDGGDLPEIRRPCESVVSRRARRRQARNDGGVSIDEEGQSLRLEDSLDCLRRPRVERLGDKGLVVQGDIRTWLIPQDFLDEFKLRDRDVVEYPIGVLWEFFGWRKER